MPETQFRKHLCCTSTQDCLQHRLDQLPCSIFADSYLYGFAQQSLQKKKLPDCTKRPCRAHQGVPEGPCRAHHASHPSGRGNGHTLPPHHHGPGAMAVWRSVLAAAVAALTEATTAWRTVIVLLKVPQSLFSALRESGIIGMAASRWPSMDQNGPRLNFT